MYLVDTNIFAEVLLLQENLEEAKLFLDKTPSQQLYITEFSIYSIGIILIREKEYNAYIQFITDVFTNAKVQLIRLTGNDLKKVTELAKIFKLDFDDAYQYTAAEKFDLQIVSFDKDFDKTPRGRKLPGEIKLN